MVRTPPLRYLDAAADLDAAEELFRGCEYRRKGYDLPAKVRKQFEYQRFLSQHAQRPTWSQVWRHGLPYLGMDGSPPPEIGAPPVVLRSYRGDELPALLEAVTASLDHLRPWLPWASVEPLEPGLSEFVRQSVAKFRRAENFDYAIWDDVASLLVGGAGLHPRLGPGRIEIGYWVRDGWLRRGIATATARALTSAAFTMSGIEEVHIHCDEANMVSAAVPNRLGFRLPKIVDDEVDAPAEVGRSMEWVMSRANWL